MLMMQSCAPLATPQTRSSADYSLLEIPRRPSCSLARKVKRFHRSTRQFLDVQSTLSRGCYSYVKMVVTRIILKQALLRVDFTFISIRKQEATSLKASVCFYLYLPLFYTESDVAWNEINLQRLTVLVSEMKWASERASVFCGRWWNKSKACATKSLPTCLSCSVSPEKTNVLPRTGKRTWES